MAGDWIKMRIDLQTHPKIVRILSAMRPHDVQTRTDKFRVVGGLHAVWSVFDTHSSDGVLHGYTPETLDHIIGWDGFAGAMMHVGWLEFDGAESLALPEFEEHNGQSAKRRGEDQKRKRNGRRSPEPVPHECGQSADKKRTREEKRREDKEEPPLTPLSTVVDAIGQKGEAKVKRQTGEFERFWAAWPKSPRKVGKAACEKKWKALGLDGHADEILAHVEAMASSQQWREGFEPAPATYLNQKRWQDGVPADRPAQQPGQQHDGDWWESKSEIEARAVDLGLKQKPDEHFQWFKCRVAKAAGERRWIDRILADLLRTKSSHYARVYEFFNGTPPMEGI